MNISTVNELIQSLESAGELSIKEQKYLELAKEFKQLAAENVGLNKFIKQSCYVYNGDGSDISDSYTPAHESPMMPIQSQSLLPVAAECLAIRDAFIRYLTSENLANKPDANEQQVYNHCAKWVDAMYETPATARIVDGIKADRVEEFSADLGAVYQQLRQGSAQAKTIKSVIFRAAAFSAALREGADK
ncbi:hypothetical protein AAH566_003535 [Klebsiella michiganensis]